MTARGLSRAYLACALAAAVASGTVEARSKSARATFQRENPCPATGKSRGACPGWQVDHITPLKCNGADAPHNMQWLTVEQHKIKTRAESKLCRR